MTLKILFFLSFEKKQKTTGVVSTNAFVFFSTSGWELHGHVDMFRSVVVLFFRFDSWYPPGIRKPDSASAIDLQEVWQLDLIVLQILQKLQIRTTHPGLILWLGFCWTISRIFLVDWAKRREKKVVFRTTMGRFGLQFSGCLPVANWFVGAELEDLFIPYEMGTSPMIFFFKKS